MSRERRRARAPARRSETPSDSIHRAATVAPLVAPPFGAPRPARGGDEAHGSARRVRGRLGFFRPRRPRARRARRRRTRGRRRGFRTKTRSRSVPADAAGAVRVRVIASRLERGGRRLTRGSRSVSFASSPRRRERPRRVATIFSGTASRARRDSSPCARARPRARRAVDTVFARRRAGRTAAFENPPSTATARRGAFLSGRRPPRLSTLSAPTRRARPLALRRRARVRGNAPKPTTALPCDSGAGAIRRFMGAPNPVGGLEPGKPEASSARAGPARRRRRATPSSAAAAARAAAGQRVRQARRRLRVFVFGVRVVTSFSVRARASGSAKARLLERRRGWRNAPATDGPAGDGRRLRGVRRARASSARVDEARAVVAARAVVGARPFRRRRVVFLACHVRKPPERTQPPRRRYREVDRPGGRAREVAPPVARAPFRPKPFRPKSSSGQ